MIQKIFCPALMIGIVLFTLIGCKQPEVPEYLGFQNMRILKADAQQSILFADVKFYNPNGYAMQLKKAEIDVYVNDQLANHYILDSTINIPAKDSFWVPVSIQLDMKKILNNALQSLLNDQVKIKLDGYARVKKGSFGFRVPVHYEETEKLSQLMGGR